MNCKKHEYTKLYVKTGNEQAPWFHNSEDIVKALSNLGIKLNNLE